MSEDTIYCWTSLRKKVHIINPDTDRTWCQIENTGPSTAIVLQATRYHEPYSGGELCLNCVVLRSRVKKSEAEFEVVDDHLRDIAKFLNGS